MLIRYSFAIGLKTCWTSSRFAASSSLRTVAASGTAEVIGRIVDGQHRRLVQAMELAGLEPATSLGAITTNELGGVG